jgi:signal transduction histidine kinase
MAARHETSEPAERSLTKPLVLLVEDEPSLSKLVGNLLNESGYEFVSISDHKQVTDAIARWRPRCVILDGDPGSRGHELSWADAAAIRRAHPGLPVIMFTADPASLAEARAGTTARSKAAGYAGVIDKPFLVVEFLATLRHAVDRPEPSSPMPSAPHADETITVFPELAGPASAGRTIADFFSMALHELRTPLTAINGQAQFAQRFVNKDPQRVADALNRIQEQATRMNRLINDLLEDARVSAGALRLDVVSFDLPLALATTIAQYEHEDDPRITLHSPVPLRMRGDPDRIAQIISNLLDNAIKYSPPRSPIDVSVAVIGDEAQVHVSDHGVGVPDDERGLLFAPFFRTTRTREITGTGLGLHISRKIAELHRGRLWLESSGPGGSVFALALPLDRPADTPA